MDLRESAGGAIPENENWGLASLGKSPDGNVGAPNFCDRVSKSNLSRPQAILKSYGCANVNASVSRPSSGLRSARPGDGLTACRSGPGAKTLVEIPTAMFQRPRTERDCSLPVEEVDRCAVLGNWLVR